MRPHLASAALLVLLVAAGSACVAPDDGDSSIDDVDATPGGVDGGGDGTGATCEAPATTLPRGMHNAGAACLSCHNGTVAPRWQVAGTLYATAQGGGAIAGATVIITDANNVTTRLVTAQNGNFYTGQDVAFPIRITASRCPDTRTMGGASSSGDCNSCHQAASAGRIHLP